MSLVIAIGLILAVFFTSLLSGVFGMAGGMILLWLLLFMLPVSTAIAIQGIIQMIANGSRAWFTQAYIDWRILGTMMIGLVAIVVLLWLVRYQPDLPTVLIGVGLLPILVWIPKSWLALDAGRPLHALACGFLSGGLNLTVGVAGPTVDIFFIRTEIDRRRVIATKAAMQVVSHAAKVVFYASATFTLGGLEWTAIAIAAPIAILGTKAGNLILERITDANFRSWTRYLVTGIGMVFLVRGVLLVV